ncbi:MarR family winged helix-turn-helix transcriptional regulator [Caulobacter segnis]|uniref:MarR family transcriptional regulator n=1 Tax=Caulobacter segnis TaxID=88688 RepID=A0A2W5UZM3_9CAUL|nr:MarR family transcriptional regulator [Caulobacter segnis]PZR31917.1 MAG: MarR family transcriptional regulator [Caulobacter segnis]
MIAPLQPGSDDPRLILREEELDGGLELILLAEASLWAAVDAVLESESVGLGRSHWRAAFLLRRRPGIGVQDLSKLTSLSKQAASRTLSDLQKAGLVERGSGELDGRRRPATLTPEGVAFEQRTAERLRALLARAYRTGGLDGVAGARRILAALAGPRQGVGVVRRPVS